jgi:hypothetical protein
MPGSVAAVLAGGYLASRLIVLVAAVVAERLVVRNLALTSGSDLPILQSLASWDGWFYLGIARSGYHALPVAGSYHDYAFQPLYPALVALLSAPWPGAAGFVAVLISNVAFAVAMVLLYHLGRPTLGPRRAAAAAVLLAIFPFAAVFAMAYPESLFLAFSVGAFLAAERDHRGTAGILLALAALTRLQGPLLIIPMAILFLRKNRWRPRPSLAWLLLAPLAAGGFAAYVSVLTGDPGAYVRAFTAWGRTGPAVAPDGGSLGAGIAAGGPAATILAVLLVTLLVAVFLLVFIYHTSIRLEYGLVAVTYLMAVLASGLLESVGRYVMLAWPYAWILAGRRSHPFNTTWPLLSAGLMGLFSLLMFSGFWVP